MPLHKKTYWITLIRGEIVAMAAMDGRHPKVTYRRLNEKEEFQEIADCRAFRLCGRPESRFILLSIREAPEEALRTMLKHWMTGGYIYRGQRYSFFGFTDTQTTSKKPKLMFFAEGPDWTVKSLLESFGDLQSVYETHGYGKYAARLHLAFSGTVPSLDVPGELVKEIPGFEALDGSLHTDGIGMIRDSLAAEICEFNKIPHDTSAFQIRRGGIKGVLVRYPDSTFDSLVGVGEHGPYNIAYRGSMRKFEGGPTDLELVNVSQAPRTSQLNIQLILLLLTLGVPLNVFERMLKKQLEAMEDIPTNRARAIECIARSYRSDPSEPDLDPGEDGPTLSNWGQRRKLTSMLEAPQDMAEPYLRDQLLKFQRWQYKHLAEKLQLQVKKACYVMGVVDELGVLEEDEVFLKLPHRAEWGNSEYITGQVAITRMPCFSTGDIRKFTAIVRPELDHVRNCVVFSRKSSRSIPDMLASGDLDGDLYMVIWDRALISPTERPALPRASKSSQPPTTLKNPPERMTADAIDTFVRYRGQDLLVAKLHGQWVEAAQATPALADSPLARGLVTLNEKALDMVKNGVNPQDIEAQRLKLLVQSRVTALEPSHSRGHWIVGVPNKHVNPIDMLRNHVYAEQARVQAMQRQQNIVPPRKPCTPHPSLDLERQDPQLFAKYFSEARRTMRVYNRMLMAAIQLDEGNVPTREPGDVRHVDMLKQSFMQQYFGGTAANERANERMRASAWYCYAYGEGKVEFAWLGARYLNEICAGKHRPLQSLPPC